MKNLVSAVFLFTVVLVGSALAGQWTAPVLVGGVVNTGSSEAAAFLSSDGLSLYFNRTTDHDGMYQATRSTPSGSFTSVTELTAVTGVDPWVSTDNLRMYYYGPGWAITMTQRNSVTDNWTAGTGISALNTRGMVCSPTLTADELTIVFVGGNPSGDAHGADLYMASRANKSSSFGNVVALTNVNSSSAETEPYLSPDGLSLYFGSARNGNDQIFESTRNTLSDTFGAPVQLSFVDKPNWPTGGPSLSSDGKALYFNMFDGSDQGIYVSYLTPEPATISLFGLGLVALRSRRKS